MPDQRLYQPSQNFIKELGGTIKDLRNYIQITHDAKTQQNYINKQLIPFEKASEIPTMTIEEAKDKGLKIFQAEMQNIPEETVYIGEEALTL